MLNDNKQNIEDFFYNQLNDYEKSPPSMIWENIEKGLLPQSTWQKFVNISNIKKIFIAASIITAASLAFYFIGNNENRIQLSNNDFASNFNRLDKFEKVATENIKEITAIVPKAEKNIVSNNNNSNTPKKIEVIAVKTEKIEKPIEKKEEIVIVTEVTKPKTMIDSSSIYKEKKSTIVNTVKSKKKYYLNTANLGDIKSIIFKNKANVEVLKYSPSKKENIIPIDVGTLPEGEYNILIENEKGIKPYKKVSIK